MGEPRIWILPLEPEVGVRVRSKVTYLDDERVERLSEYERDPHFPDYWVATHNRNHRWRFGELLIREGELTEVLT
jgi:hypothetical protein